eukprot:31838-Eustigmatos_ZCMA.PRE.1
MGAYVKAEPMPPAGTHKATGTGVDLMTIRMLQHRLPAQPRRIMAVAARPSCMCSADLTVR